MMCLISAAANFVAGGTTGTNSSTNTSTANRRSGDILRRNSADGERNRRNSADYLSPHEHSSPESSPQHVDSFPESPPESNQEFIQNESIAKKKSPDQKAKKRFTFRSKSADVAPKSKCLAMTNLKKENPIIKDVKLKLQKIETKSILERLLTENKVDLEKLKSNELQIPSSSIKPFSSQIKTQNKLHQRPLYHFCTMRQNIHDIRKKKKKRGGRPSIDKKSQLYDAIEEEMDPIDGKPLITPHDAVARSVDQEEDIEVQMNLTPIQEEISHQIHSETNDIEDDSKENLPSNQAALLANCNNESRKRKRNPSAQSHPGVRMVRRGSDLLKPLLHKRPKSSNYHLEESAAVSLATLKSFSMKQPIAAKLATSTEQSSSKSTISALRAFRPQKAKRTYPPQQRISSRQSSMEGQSTSTFVLPITPSCDAAFDALSKSNIEDECESFSMISQSSSKMSAEFTELEFTESEYSENEGDEEDLFGSETEDYSEIQLQSWKKEISSKSCFVGLDDVFSPTPLEKFKCEGCDQSYDAVKNKVTLSFLKSEFTTICGHCSWWTKRKFSSNNPLPYEA